jgi:hypothetical protein
MLPAPACAHASGAAPLKAQDLRLVWLEEGDAVALLEKDEILAIIPGWSGLKGFEGYARDCTAESRICWPLAKDNALHARVRRADEFWRSWANANPWEEIKNAGVAAIEAGIGKQSNYYAIDEGKWPPKALLRIPKENATALVTCGVSIRPQPKAEQAPGEPVRRIELGMAIETSILERNPRAIMGYLSVQAALPWWAVTWLGPGHTVPCDAIPISPNGVRFEAVLLLRDPPGAPAVAFPPYRGDPVQLLWMVPITKAERELAMKDGSENLARRLREAGHGWIHRYRDPVVS